VDYEYLPNGIRYENKDYLKKAIECYDKAIKLNPTDEEPWYNKGVALGKLERYKEAIECYDRVIELNPTDEDAWYNKGNDLGELERHEEAIECYDKAIELNPIDEEPWYSKGVELERLGRKDEQNLVSKKLKSWVTRRAKSFLPKFFHYSRDILHYVRSKQPIPFICKC
jgi:tetratricopeptide (TPR) repeat protein